MKSREGWKWYGFAGHLCVGRRCAFHLCTRVGPYLVSTVGAYYPKDSDDCETIGAGKDDYFETMVFPCHGDDADGNPNNDLSEIECVRYSESIKAERGHYVLCEKYAEIRC